MAGNKFLMPIFSLNLLLFSTTFKITVLRKPNEHHLSLVEHTVFVIENCGELYIAELIFHLHLIAIS